MRYEHFIGLRHLVASQHRFLNTLTLLAVCGVALGVAAFTTVVSVAGGFVDTFEDRVLGVNPHLVITKFGLHFSEYPDVREAIAEVDGVVSTAPFVVREMLVVSANSSARPGALVKGIDPSAVIENEDLRGMVVAGDLDALRYDGGLFDVTADNTPRAGVALGKVLADRLEADVGDSLTLVSPLRGLRSLGIGADSAGADYARVQVVAIVDSGFYDYDSRLAVMDYTAVQELLGLGDVVLGVEVRVEDPHDTGRISEEIEGRLTTGRFRSLDWRAINRNLFSSLQLQKLALTAVMSILVLVASLVILCVLVMLVLEKRREIAILRSMGATSGGILRVFVSQGMAIGALGTALGLVGGLLGCAAVGAVDFPLAYEVYRVESLPVAPHPVEFAGAALASLLTCFIATLYPAWRASKVPPVDALRYD